MKIVSGKLANQPIIFSKKSSVRPTGAIVRKSLMGTLKNDLKHAFFLDLFAGTGMVGMEAYSNGASYVGFLEKDFNLHRLLLRNVEKYTIPSLIVKGDYGAKMKFFAKKALIFDFVFIDPPYSFTDYEKVTTLVLKLALLKKGGLIIIEKKKATRGVTKGVTRGGTGLTEGFQAINQLKGTKTKIFGGTSLEYYRKY